MTGTKLGLNCVSQCDHTDDANTACWPCIEVALKEAESAAFERAANVAESHWLGLSEAKQSIAAAIRDIARGE